MPRGLDVTDCGELEKIRMELDNRFFRNMQLGKIDPI
jgi:hypothetical protein